MYVKKICCGNCGSLLPIYHEVEIGDEIVCYCPNCCQIRKEKLKDSEVEK